MLSGSSQVTYPMQQNKMVNASFLITLYMSLNIFHFGIWIWNLKTAKNCKWKI